MEWFVERHGSREGPYQAGEIAARVAAGTLPADCPVVSTSGELHLTAGALVAASATAPAPPPVPATIIPPPPSPVRPHRSRLPRWAAAISPFEWTLGGLIVLGIVAMFLPLPWYIGLMPIVASIVAIAIDAGRHGLGTLALAKTPLSRLERWPVSTWVVSAAVLWIIYAPIYLMKRRRLLACVADIATIGSYASAKDMGDARRGVAGAALVAREAPHNRRDLILQVGGLGVAIIILYAAFFSPLAHRSWASTEQSAAESELEDGINAIVDVMNAHARAKAYRDVSETLAVMERIDTSGCPRDYQVAYEAHRAAVREWDARRRTAGVAATIPMNDDARGVMALLALISAYDSDRKIKETYAEMLRVAKTYGVEYE